MISEPETSELRTAAVRVNEMQLSEAALHILLTAERLFAEQGVDTVSTRLIARDAGQKNVSALHYHFGDKRSLIEAIIDYRITPVNAERLRRLRQLKQSGMPVSVKALVRVFVEPFALELLKPKGDIGYISLLSQLYSSQWGRELYLENRKRARELHEITSLLIKKLMPMPVLDVHLKLQFLVRLTIASVAEWHEVALRNDDPLDNTALNWRIGLLVDFLAGGLQPGN